MTENEFNEALMLHEKIEKLKSDFESKKHYYANNTDAGAERYMNALECKRVQNAILTTYEEILHEWQRKFDAILSGDPIKES